MSIEYPRDWSHQITFNLTDLAQLKDHSPARLTPQLLAILNTHHPGTFDHSQSVYTVGTALADKLGVNSPELSDMLLLHDIGKLFVPRHLLSRTTNGHLVDSNLRLYRDHFRLSAEILRYLGYPDLVSQVARLHHTNFQSIQDNQSLFVGEVCLPSLLRLADCTAAALDFNRSYQTTPTVVGVTLNIWKKIDDIVIQLALGPVWSEYMKEVTFPSHDRIIIT